MEFTIDELRANYKKLSDDKLINIATTDASGLRPEAIQVLKEEIKSRGLSENLFEGIEIQRKEISETELLDSAELLRQMPCPICGSNAQNAYKE